MQSFKNFFLVIDTHETKKYPMNKMFMGDEYDTRCSKRGEGG